MQHDRQAFISGLGKGLVVAWGMLAGTSSALAAPASPAQATFATELQEVRSTSMNGREYLTIHINGDVGPASCRGSVLKVDTTGVEQGSPQERLGSLALSAMLTSDSVMITVPLTNDQCVDGMPTLTNMYVLRAGS